MRAVLILCAALSFTFADIGSSAAESNSPKDGTIPFKRGEEVASAGSLLRVVLSLGFVVVAGVGVLYLLKRYVPASLGRMAGSEGRIEILETRRVTPRLTLFLIKIDGETVLLTQSGDRVMHTRLTKSSSSTGDGIQT